VPISPDGEEHVHDGRLNEVRNIRHGSLARPIYHDQLAPGSALARLLEQMRTLRADLRFREDGVHTVLTIDRKAKEK
jgi:hypothetical protein